MTTNSIRWIFRPQLIVAALAAAFAWTSIGRIADAFSYRGPYIVAYGEDGENIQRVSRIKFLRHHVTNDGLILVLSIAAWSIAARTLKDKEDEFEKSISSLKYRISLLNDRIKNNND